MATMVSRSFWGVLISLGAIASLVCVENIEILSPPSSLLTVQNAKDLLDERDKALNAVIAEALKGPDSPPQWLKQSQLEVNQDVPSSQQFSDSDLAHQITQVFRPKGSPLSLSKKAQIESLLLSAQDAAQSIQDTDAKQLSYSGSMQSHQSNRNPYSALLSDKNNKRRRRHLRRKQFEESRKQPVRIERKRYDAMMQEAESDLSDGYPHQAQRDLGSALRHYREEQRLKGFLGQAARIKPKAWRNLDKTVNDDINDHLQAHRIEREMDRVIKVRDKVESARHKFEEEKTLVNRMRKTGLDGLFRLSTREGGLIAEKSLANRLEKRYTKEDRLWLRAQSLERAKLDAVEKAAPAPKKVAHHQFRQASTSPAVRRIPAHPVPTESIKLSEDLLPTESQLQQQHANTRKAASKHSKAKSQQEISLGSEHLGSIEIGGVDTPSDISLYGHELKLRKLGSEEHAEDATSAQKKKKPKAHTQATDEILVRLLSLAHAGLLHPHMSLGLSRRPVHREAGGDVHSEAMSELAHIADRSLREGRRHVATDAEFGKMISKQILGSLKHPNIAPRPTAPLPRQDPRVETEKAHAVGDARHDAAIAKPSPPSSVWGVVSWPMDYLFHDAKVSKVMVPS